MGTGLTFACFHSEGNSPRYRLALNREVRLLEIEGATMRSNRAEMPSDPVAFLSSRAFSFLKTISSSREKKLKYAEIGSIPGKTEEKIHM